MFSGGLPFEISSGEAEPAGLSGVPGLRMATRSIKPKAVTEAETHRMAQEGGDGLPSGREAGAWPGAMRPVDWDSAPTLRILAPVDLLAGVSGFPRIERASASVSGSVSMVMTLEAQALQ